MKKRTPYLLLLLLTALFACSEEVIEPEPEPIDLNAPHIAFKLNGEEKSLVPNGVNVGGFVTKSGVINSFDPPEYVGRVGYGGGYETTTGYMEVFNRFEYLNSDFQDDFVVAMKNEYAVGSYSYLEGYIGLGVKVEYKDNTLGALTTKTGGQTGSTFHITEIVSTSQSVEHDITAKGTFSCKLYNEDLVSYSVTEGTFYVRFEL